MPKNTEFCWNLSDEATFLATDMSDWVEVLHPTQHKMGHFADSLHSKSLSLVLKN